MTNNTSATNTRKLTENKHCDGADLTILACQIAVAETNTTAARDSHLKNTAAKIIEAAKPGNMQLIVLPELASIDYSRASFEQLSVLAEPLEGPSTECWREVATQCNTHIVYSFPRTDTHGYTICVAVVDPSGKLTGHYDKMHLAQYGASMEKDYFQRGNHIFTFDINGIRLAPIICYDIRFPELCRCLATEHEVNVILHCGAYYRDESFHTWHDFARTRAVENQLYFLSLNRAGTNYGQSLFCPPWIDNTVTPVEFALHDEEFKIIHINRHAIDFAREKYSFLHDRLNHY